MGSGTVELQSEPPDADTTVMSNEKHRRARNSQDSGIEIIVRRGALRRFDRLKERTADLPVKVSWDRRQETPAGDHPQTERRKEPPFTWTAADFVVVERDPEA